MLGLNLLLGVGKFVYGLIKEKSKHTDRAVEGFGKLETRMVAIERDMNEMLKMRQDFRRIFTALKAIAGDKWPEVRKAVLEDDLGGINKD